MTEKQTPEFIWHVIVGETIDELEKQIEVLQLRLKLLKKMRDRFPKVYREMILASNEQIE